MESLYSSGEWSASPSAKRLVGRDEGREVRHARLAVPLGELGPHALPRLLRAGQRCDVEQTGRALERNLARGAGVHAVVARALLGRELAPRADRERRGELLGRRARDFAHLVERVAERPERQREGVARHVARLLRPVEGAEQPRVEGKRAAPLLEAALVPLARDEGALGRARRDVAPRKRLVLGHEGANLHDHAALDAAAARRRSGAAGRNLSRRLGELALTLEELLGRRGEPGQLPAVGICTHDGKLGRGAARRRPAQQPGHRAVRALRERDEQREPAQIWRLRRHQLAARIDQRRGERGKPGGRLGQGHLAQKVLVGRQGRQGGGGDGERGEHGPWQGF
mmetsp:Transcript_21878/g.70490  ORF Transcript_21878/g.70490 Transcript_21878/m.70490 type:complete len:341 (+) Transcript_21878:107-1129(+)